MLSRSLPVENRKGLACDVSDALATHSTHLVHDVTDADCWAQYGSSQTCIIIRKYIAPKLENKYSC